jgi:hypothetical protein
VKPASLCLEREAALVTSLSVAFFRDVFLALFTRHMLLMAMLSLVVGVLWFDLGGRLGVPLLFWHPRRTTQAVAGAALAGLLQTIILTSYLRDRPSLAPSYASASTYFLGCTWGLLLVLVASFAVAKLVRRPTQPEAPLLVGLVLTTALVLLAGDLLARLPVPDGLDGSLGAWPFFANLPEGDRHLHLVALVVFVVALFVFGGVRRRQASWRDDPGGGALHGVRFDRAGSRLHRGATRDGVGRRRRRARRAPPRGAAAFQASGARARGPHRAPVLARRAAEVAPGTEPRFVAWCARAEAARLPLRSR